MPQTNNESEAKIPAKRRKSPRRRWKRALWLLPVLLTLLILRVERNVTDVVLTLSQATARSLAIQALNEAASEMLGLGVHYADLMTVEKDEQGQVRLIQANTPEMNRLAAQASLLAQERLTAMGQKTVVVPLGSAIGLTLLAGAGPGIAVQILPVGSVQAAFSTDFTTAGINQTRHRISLVLTAKNDEGAKTKAITLGANAYITKPFSKEYLLARIDQLLAERKLFRERIRQQMENQTTTEEDSYEQFLVKKDVQFLEKIHQVIEENMDDSDFNIDTIASGIGLSRSAFFKKLKSLTGLAPVDLVKEIRLNKSIELIKNTDLSVSEIAFAVGFKDSGYYSKCFRKKYNQSPREYMNEWRKGER